jgi:phosphoribosylformylglycinamidine synthase
MALDGNSRWCYLDPKLGAMHAVAEAARKVACTGATPVAATNCLNFGNPEKPEIMAQLSAAIDGIGEACLALGTPITGGNVSLYNETRGEGIYPTPVIGIVGIIEDVSKAVPADFQAIGDDVLLLIFQGDDDEPSHKPSLEQQFGSSEFAKHLLHGTWGVPPGLSLRDEANLHRGLAALANSRLLQSASDAADGGVLVAIAESMFAKGIGFESSKPFRFGYAPDPRPLEYVMQWNELSSAVVVSCDSSNTERVIQIAQEHGATGAYRIGTTVPHRFILHGSEGDSPDIDASLSELKAAWSGTLNSLLTEVHA